MARRQKPPGYEKWTWEEIKLGHRLSKAEKRARRIARHLGATEDANGKLNAPEGGDKFLYYFVLVVILVFSLSVIIVSILR